MGDIQSAQQLEELFEQYPFVGSVVFSSDDTSFTGYSFDAEGNRLTIKATAGEMMQYEITPVKRETDGTRTT